MDTRDIADLLGSTYGQAGRLWEPLWRIESELSPVEQELLEARCVRRLHHISHGGASAIASHQTYTRLQHTLGVFALCAHLAPGDVVLRVAALLHDVGHLPFSHTLQEVLAFRHHERTVQLITSAPVSEILHRHAIEPTKVADVVTGRSPTLLRNDVGVVQLDHLDSWVRNARSRGILPVPPDELLAGTHLGSESGIEFDVEVAEAILDLVVAEAHHHCSSVDLGPATVLRALVERLLEVGAVDVDEIASATDADVAGTIRRHDATRTEAERLWFRPFEIEVARADEGPDDGYRVRVDHLYLSEPRVTSESLRRWSPDAAERLGTAKALLGEYVVWWRKDRSRSTNG